MAGALYFIGAGEAKDVGVGAIKALSSLYKRAKFVKKEIQAVNLTGAKGVKHAERYFNQLIDAKKLPDGHMWTYGSPFKNKTAAELHEMFIKKGFTDKGMNPSRGYGCYFSPKGRKYYVDPYEMGSFREVSHVDIYRAEEYMGSLVKKRLMYDGKKRIIQRA